MLETSREHFVHFEGRLTAIAVGTFASTRAAENELCERHRKGCKTINQEHMIRLELIDAIKVARQDPCSKSQVRLGLVDEVRSSPLVIQSPSIHKCPTYPNLVAVGSPAKPR